MEIKTKVNVTLIMSRSSNGPRATFYIPMPLMETFGDFVVINGECHTGLEIRAAEPATPRATKIISTSSKKNCAVFLGRNLGPLPDYPVYVKDLDAVLTNTNGEKKLTIKPFDFRDGERRKARVVNSKTGTKSPDLFSPTRTLLTHRATNENNSTDPLREAIDKIRSAGGIELYRAVVTLYNNGPRNRLHLRIVNNELVVTREIEF